MAKPVIGLLALQGDFQEHRETLQSLKYTTVDVRLPRDLEGIDALILPGGESTTILKLLKLYDLYDLVIKLGEGGMPMYGTCAGTIVLGKDADRLDNKPLGLIDISVHRNAYGRQVDSFEERLDFPAADVKVPGIFIRAPLITRLGDGVEILISTIAGDPVMVRKDNILVSTFHPELSESSVIHKYFVEKMVIPAKEMRSAQEVQV